MAFFMIAVPIIFFRSLQVIEISKFNAPLILLSRAIKSRLNPPMWAFCGGGNFVLLIAFTLTDNTIAYCPDHDDFPIPRIETFFSL